MCQYVKMIKIETALDCNFPLFMISILILNSYFFIVVKNVIEILIIELVQY